MLAIGGLGYRLLIVGLVLLHGGIVVYEDEGREVGRIAVASGAHIARTEVAGWIVAWECHFRRGFLLPSTSGQPWTLSDGCARHTARNSLPWPLHPMGRNQDP